MVPTAGCVVIVVMVFDEDAGTGTGGKWHVDVTTGNDSTGLLTPDVGDGVKLGGALRSKPSFLSFSDDPCTSGTSEGIAALGVEVLGFRFLV